MPLYRIVLMLAVATTAGAQEMRNAEFFTGRWSCTHTVGDFKGTYTTTISSALGGQWLRQVYTFPDKSAEFFIGYDPRVKRWVRWGMLSTGEYWAMTGARSDNKWKWIYVLPGRDTTGAVWTKKSDAEYLVDGPTYPENGKTVTEHHDCRKS